MEKTGDPIIDILAKVIERYHRKTVVPTPSRYEHTNPPKLNHILLTHIIDTSDEFSIATRGSLLGVPLKPEYPKAYIWVQTHVGLSQGAGQNVQGAYVPYQHGYPALESIMDTLVKTSRFAAAHDFYERFGSTFSEPRGFQLATLKRLPRQEPYFGQIYKYKLPQKRLKEMLNRASSILKPDGSIRESSAIATYIDRERRLVTSDGRVIHDQEHGIRILLVARIRDKDGVWLDFYDSVTVTSSGELSLKKVESVAKRLRGYARERVDCEKVRPGELATIMFDATGMSTELHEAVVHHLASNEMIPGQSAAYGYQNYDKLIADPRLSIWIGGGNGLGWGSRKYDAEGVSVARKALVDHGILKGFIADRNGAAYLEAMIHEHLGKEVEIYPGDTFTCCSATESEIIVPTPQPRTGYLEFDWDDPKKPRSWDSLLKLYKRIIKTSGQSAIVVFNCGAPGFSYTERPVGHGFHLAGYRLSPDGAQTPLSPFFTTSTPQDLLQNIAAMAHPRQIVRSYCGLTAENVEDHCVDAPETFVIGPGIIKNLRVHPVNQALKWDPIYPPPQQGCCHRRI
ncbi:hypothetical protein J4464_01735 [Candidatus Woesearchaeota archaeon]|nr:hypothetical protein [uncultured archaeon]MBS3142086.1 hypothetical protein [Candidatus Woesearchaeota archaeon]